MTPHRPRRPAFTLVELLVALGIMLVLIAIALLLANSGILSNHRITSGSDRISGWLIQARAKAQRDGAPRGVRFVADPGTGYILEAQWIEVPDPYTMPAGNRLMIGQWPAGAGGTERHIYIVGPNAADVLTNVAVGDTVSIPDFDTLHRVSAVPVVVNTTAGAGVEIPVANPNLIPDTGIVSAAPGGGAPPVTFAAAGFGFFRQARPIFGEPPLQVPEGLIIDINLTNSTDPNNAANPSLSLIPFTLDPSTGERRYDVLFSPNGEVQNAGGLGRVMLWVRNRDAFAGNPRAGGDLRSTYETAGEMTLITVYSRGGVAIHPVAVPPPNPTANDPVPGHDPYKYTRDGIASGL